MFGNLGAALTLPSDFLSDVPISLLALGGTSLEQARGLCQGPVSWAWGMSEAVSLGCSVGKDVRVYSWGQTQHSCLKGQHGPS